LHSDDNEKCGEKEGATARWLLRNAESVDYTVILYRLYHDSQVGVHILYIINYHTIIK